MKYELPKSLKRHSFFCKQYGDFVNFNKCTNYCRSKTQGVALACWKDMVKGDLVMDADVTNEKNAENYAICPSCKKDDSVVGCAFNSFLCSDCGCTFSLDKGDIKELLKEDYEELDEGELDALLDKIKI